MEEAEDEFKDRRTCATVLDLMCHTPAPRSRTRGLNVTVSCARVTKASWLRPDRDRPGPAKVTRVTYIIHTRHYSSTPYLTIW